MRIPHHSLSRFLVARPSERVEEMSAYPLAGVQGFGRGVLIRSTIRGHETQYKSLTKLSKGDVVYSKLKAFEGAIAVVCDTAAGHFVSPEFPVFRVDPGVSSKYLSHILSSTEFIAQLSVHSSGIGARRERVSPASFLSLTIPVPGLDEQRRIAAYLDLVAANVEGLGARRQAVAGLGSVAMLPRMVDAALRARDLPRVAVSALVDSVNDTIHPGGDYRGAHDFIGLEYIESHTGFSIGSRPVGDETGRKFRFEPGDITFGYLRPYLNKVWVSDRVGLCSVEQFVLRPHPDVDGNLLGHVLRSQAVLDATRAATNSLQLPRLPLAVLLGLEVPDIRRADVGLLPSLNDLRDRVKSVVELRVRADALAGGIVAAARNEIFSAMR